MAQRSWVSKRRDMIGIDCNFQLGREMKDIHQPKSFEWRRRGAKPHPWKRAPDDVFRAACDTLNQIIELTN